MPKWCINGVVGIIQTPQTLGKSGGRENYEIRHRITIFNIVVLAICVFASILIGTGFWQISENGEKYFAALIVAAVILFSGNIAPKLPYSKHTGLRLPWTILDEDTWTVAHRILGYISIPLGIVYIAGVPIIENFTLLTFVIIILWIGIPGALSYIFFHNNHIKKL